MTVTPDPRREKTGKGNVNTYGTKTRQYTVKEKVN